MCSPSKPQINKDTIVYPPTCGCIYCGGNKGNRSREHIVPLALDGSLILREASCKKCADIINREIEGPLLRVMFGNARARLGMREKRRRDTNKKGGKQPIRLIRQTDAEVMRGNTSRNVNVDFDVAPLCVPGLQLRPPQILLTRQEEIYEMKLWFSWNEDELNNYVELLGPHVDPGEALNVASINPLMFCRLIAKIAHGFAIAEVGLHAHTYLLNDLILGREKDPFHLIGGTGLVTSNRPATEAHRLHLFEVENQEKTEKFLAVSVDLFSSFEIPHYVAIVAKLN